jgi:nucleoside diphosphate kinase
LMFRNSVRARFGSTSFLEKQFGSVRFDFVFDNEVRIWFESSSASSTKSEINN